MHASVCIHVCMYARLHVFTSVYIRVYICVGACVGFTLELTRLHQFVGAHTSTRFRYVLARESICEHAGAHGTGEHLRGLFELLRSDW